MDEFFLLVFPIRVIKLSTGVFRQIDKNKSVFTVAFVIQWNFFITSSSYIVYGIGSSNLRVIQGCFKAIAAEYLNSTSTLHNLLNKSFATLFFKYNLLREIRRIKKFLFYYFLNKCFFTISFIVYWMLPFE